MFSKKWQKTMKYREAFGEQRRYYYACNGLHGHSTGHDSQNRTQKIPISNWQKDLLVGAVHNI